MWEIVPARLEAAMRRVGINRSQLAAAVGVSQPSISRLLSGETKTTRVLDLIAATLRTTPSYLKGDVENPELDTDGEDTGPLPNLDDVEIDSIDLAYGMGGTFLDGAVIQVEKVKFSRKWLRQFTNSPPNMLCSTRGMGDSMMPTIHDQDVVIIDRSQTVPEMGDKIWAMSFAGLGMIKRLRALPDGTMKISSDNHLVRDEIAGDGELYIVGRVVAVVKSV
ncbi:XRE family transcriptional regulator [Novosphingobium sp. 9]|uniref:XRE family transcriptional regulator n=1 Tax=Novosphingobium sp. 9 TaxID=2025349 RepID=UPI0021B4E0C2|nr:S24 family peptidase [Novosphingobium sp. 9]